MNQVPRPFPQMLNEKQAARSLAVSIGALRKWRKDGRGPEFVRLERCIRYSLQSIETFVSENSSSYKQIVRPDSVASSGGA